MSARVAALVLGTLLGLQGARDEPARRRLPLEVTVPRMEDARAQLDYARRLKGGLKDREGAEREFWRGLAVEAYQAVRHYHPEAGELGVEAAFRAGELLAAGERLEEARAEFRAALEAGAGTPYRARAALELGDLARRSGDPRRALDRYLAVASDSGAAPRHRDAAWLGAARAWSALGRPEEAHRAWTLVAEEGAEPLDRIEAFDELALRWVHEGDLEAAAGMLHRCKHALRDAALEETVLGEKVRRALSRMRVVEELPRAIERRTDSSRANGTPRKP